jgi:hypothetical protein
LKERSGVRGEDSRGSRQEEECSEEVYERVRVDSTTDEEDSSQTSEGVVEESRTCNSRRYWFASGSKYNIARE